MKVFLEVHRKILLDNTDLYYFLSVFIFPFLFAGDFANSYPDLLFRVL